MKNLIVSLVTGSVLMLTSISALAQPAVKKQDLKDVAALERERIAPPVNNMAVFRNIPIKAVRNFKNSYQQVDNETWYEVPDGYRARFTAGEVLHLVTFNKKGKWLNTIRQYDETKLARDVRAMVRSVYYDYTIVLVEEIEQSLKPVTYIIHMEDKISFKNIRVFDREMEVIGEINKL
ncbi:hypothetical protein A3860_07525 [Niastella vici]|uniref:Uncharacterized protein n=1 Tax=Niastella vici TaxID=1703345 RepID=A0A1V9FIX8_9BACT|nr:hypothetical protein [Niastella vici]OQP58166.1 hypothetical protein A3860_07525 [Niastella vici]